jgi:hypothetical protein
MSTADLPIVATAIVGVAGIAAGALTAWGQRTQAERLARQSFLRTRRGDAYTEVLTAVRRVLIHDQADRDAVTSQLLRYRDGEATTGPTSSTC